MCLENMYFNPSNISTFVIFVQPSKYGMASQRPIRTTQNVQTVSPLGENPAQIMCPKCHQTVLSEVEYSSGLFTYLFCGGLFLFVFGCCLIPFCVDRLKDAKHTCPTCKTVLGVYRRL
uniref:LITAF domain-containing protein n=1 Tax=Xiphophorus maculatus TaxID=8083 RepID=A0A3B5RCU5_XIPMA